MKRILTLSLLSLCGCVGRGKYLHNLKVMANTGHNETLNIHHAAIADLKERVEALEAFVQAARDREAQSNRYDLGGMDELAEESAKETDRKLKPELDKLLGR